MKKSLLIIGESEHFQAILAAIFSENYKVFYTGTVVEALKIVKDNIINLILTAPKLDHDTCFDFARRLKNEDGANSDIPIVLVSNNIDTDMLSKAHKNDIVDVIKLPLEPIDFEEKVQTVILKYARAYEKLDPLTGLHKKLYAEEQITDVLENDKKGALLLIEVCHYSFASSKVNDKTLSSCSNILKKLIGPNAVLAVSAGGGFIIFEPALREKEAIEKYASRIIDELREKADAKSLYVSIGLAVTDRHGYAFNDLYLSCDMGLGLARQDGRNKACFYKW